MSCICGFCLFFLPMKSCTNIQISKMSITLIVNTYFCSFFAFGQKFDVEALISRLVIKKPLFVFGLYQHSVGKQIPILQEYFYNISVFSAKKKT